MKKIHIEDSLASHEGDDANIGLLNKTKVEGKSVYKIAIRPMGCRDFMAEDLFKLKFPDKRRSMAYLQGDYNWKTGLTYVIVTTSGEKQRNNILKNIEWLNEKEEKHNIRKSVLYDAGNGCIVVVGSKYWKDSCWKQTLYTFYIRCMTRFEKPASPNSWPEDRYRESLTPEKEEQLLSKHKDQGEFADPSIFVFTGTGGFSQRAGVHDREGFVSICSGRNDPMAKHLGLIK